jgi:hypothetical protein
MDKSTTVDKVVSAPAPAPSLVEKADLETKVKSESLLQQLTSNKLYIYIIIGIIVLAVIGYYLYTKHFSKKDKSEKQEKAQETSSTKKDLESKKHILSPDTEYYLLDRSGNPILMNQYFGSFLNNSQEQSVLVNNRIVQQQENSKQKVQPQRPKLTHPNEETNVDVNITDNEDDNIATQDLTREEIEELKKQLDLMQRKQSAPITAQNDEDGEEANF